jgi:hypothetical protein
VHCLLLFVVCATGVGPQCQAHAGYCGYCIPVLSWNVLRGAAACRLHTPQCASSVELQVFEAADVSWVKKRLTAQLK